MSKPGTRPIAEMGRFGGCLVATCENPECGRVALFSLPKLTAYLIERGWSQDLDAVEARLRCDVVTGGCGSKRIRLAFRQKVSIETWAAMSIVVHAPKGVDPVDWYKADDRARKRLIRIARD